MASIPKVDRKMRLLFKEFSILCNAHFMVFTHVSIFFNWKEILSDDKPLDGDSKLYMNQLKANV